MPSLFLQTLKGEKTTRPPFWFMRQAGRYLPEYRALRSQAKNFMDFCYSPELACEATLQPIKRFGMDAAIIFSDILVIPHALGADVAFVEGKGPQLSPVRSMDDLKRLSSDGLEEKLEPVYEALRLTRAALTTDTALIGFAGSPWTLACYLVQGQGDRDFQLVRTASIANRPFFSALIELLSQSVARHAIRQIEAGAQVIQLFDSWAGVLSEQGFADWSIAPTKAIVAAIKAAHPSVPVIGFPRLAGAGMIAYAELTGIDAISIDASTSLAWARKELQSRCIVQGNLDPILLAEDKPGLLAQAKKIRSTFEGGDKNFIFNLGHGVLPHTPIEHVEALCDFLKN